MPEREIASLPGILTERLAAIRARYPGPEPRMVADVVRAVITSIDGELTVRESALLAEVQALGEFISNAKAEIAAIQVDDITDSYIPLATDELDAIVQHTASATDVILECCETLDDVAANLDGEPSSKLQNATTRIYEACSFQDITGQRITKVVNTLKTIEAKVAQVLATFGPSHHASEKPAHLAASGGTTLSGPQLPALAMDQADIDKLLASFDEEAC